MTTVGPGAESKPATAARMYDYYLGGTHNFPADRAAAEAVIKMFPLIPAQARTNRAFLRRAVRYLVRSGVRQFLDIGSGTPTAGNVHEIAQQIEPQARVVYVDIDPVAVAESLEILDGNDRATAIYGNLREPRAILAHSQLSSLLDLSQPVGLLLGAVLHFVTDDNEAYNVVRQLVGALASGSYLVVSHGSRDGLKVDLDDVQAAKDVYERKTTTEFQERTREQVARFFTGLELVDPGVVFAPEWRPEPGDPADFIANPGGSAALVAVGRLP